MQTMLKIIAFIAILCICCGLYGGEPRHGNPSYVVVPPTYVYPPPLFYYPPYPRFYPPPSVEIKVGPSPSFYIKVTKHPFHPFFNFFIPWTPVYKVPPQYYPNR